MNRVIQKKTITAGLSAVAAFGAIGAISAVATIGACGGSKPPSGGDQNGGLVAWEAVRGVLQHPRCQNCHPQEDVPLQGDAGTPHTQNVQRGPAGRGMPGMECVTCHGLDNPPASYGLHIPPGISTGWRMPKPEEKLPFVGMTSHALCEQIKDPLHNGGLDMAGLRHHMDDPLVKWGWTPGNGRAPVPLSRDAFLGAFEAWSAAGAPCPPELTQAEAAAAETSK